MIAYLEGTVLTVRKDSVILKAGFVGYEVHVLQASSHQKGDALELYCYQQFREDGQCLYGFETEEQYELFTLLIGVKGLGCRSVMNCLSAMPCEEIIRAIEQADAARLRKLPGIGAKTAGQIILDLKGKIVIDAPVQTKQQPQGSPVWMEVCEALESLGYKPAEISEAAAEFRQREDLRSDEMLRLCLKKLSGRLHFQSNS